MKYPEHEKMEEVNKKSGELIGFLEWLGEKEFEICEWDSNLEEYVSTRRNIERWLASFYGIDLVKIEKEKQHMLKEIRGEN